MKKKAPQKISSIFLSSTYEDLIPYRDAVNEALMKMGVTSKGMEFFGSKPDGPKDASLDILRQCDAYIGVFAMRYGSVCETGKSITHLEYDEAQKLGLPTYIYIIDENKQAILPSYVDVGENAEKLRGLKSLLKKQHTISFFTTPDNLSRKVTQDLKDLIIIKQKKPKELKKLTRAGVINPSVFKLLGKKYIYMMYKMRNYYKNRNYMKDATFGCYGIFGIADVCIKDICSDVEDLRASMLDIFPDLDGTPERDYLNRPEYFRVNDFFKYNGYKIDSNYEIDFSINMNDCRLEIKKLAINWDDNTVGDSMRNLLVNKHIMLGPIKQSTKKGDNIQDWIIGIFLPRESGEGMQSCERFHNFVLNQLLINDERIHTIVHSGITTGSMNLHYIMEVNASANEIWFDLVLKIHEACEKNSIIVNTKTSLVVDRLSKQTYDCILEPQISEIRLAERRQLIRTIERGMTRIELENLDLIKNLKQLDELRQEEIIELHKNASQFIKDFPRFSHLNLDLVSFLVGMIQVNKLDGKEVLDRYYSYLYLKLSSMIEAELREILKERIQKKLEKLADPNGLQALLQSIGVKAQSPNVLTYGDCIIGVINWNEKYPKDTIISKDFAINLKGLQRNNVASIRNMFAHLDYANNSKYAVPKVVEESLVASINFIKENETYLFKH